MLIDLLTHHGDPLPHLAADAEVDVDLFAGGGGASTGYEQAMGKSPDVAINHDMEALAMHMANHPKTIHYCQNIINVHPLTATGGRLVRDLWASPDCFPAGTVILTSTGYKPIEDVCCGDEVLTHKLRWKRVTATMSWQKELLKIVGRGHPCMLVSAEHPFYARKRENVWREKPTRKYERRLSEAQWVKAGDLEKGWYWGTPAAFPAMAIPEIPVYNNRALVIDERLLWLAGRYVADGWTRLTARRAELVLTCSKNKIEELRASLSVWPRAGKRCGANEITWHERHTKTAYQFTASCRGLVEWLREHFGHLATGKRIPGWLLGADRTAREAFLAGYVSGDGSYTHSGGNPLIQCTTVSRPLAFGIKSLVCSLGFSPSVYYKDNQSNCIEGRSVNVVPVWSVRWRTAIDEDHRQTELSEGIEWCQIRDIIKLNGLSTVYNLSVEDDESYVADGIIVHNCTHFSKAKGGKPRSQNIRDLAWTVVRWARLTRPKRISLENVEEFQTWGPLDAEGQPIKERAGETFHKWVAALKKLGYSVAWRELRACDYGAPTIRKRLFLCARLDGKRISWPKPTHGAPESLPVKAGKLKPWRTAAECIDWTDPAPSIFDRKKPLAENTQRRIAEGIRRYVLAAQKPFLVSYYGPKRPGDFRGAGLDEPLKTQTTENRFGLVSPMIVKPNHTASYYNCFRGQSVENPLGVITQAPGFAACSAYLVTPSHSGENFRGQSVEQPVGTMTGKGSFCLTTPHLISIDHKGKRGEFKAACREVGEPLSTVTQENRHALISASIVGCGGPSYAGEPVSVNKPMGTIIATNHKAVSIVKLRGTNIGSQAGTPLHTISAQGLHHGLMSASLSQYYSGGGQYASCTEPMRTSTANDRIAMQAIHLQQYNGCSEAQPVDDPMPTIPTRDRFGLTAATLHQHYGTSECRPVDEPAPTTMGKNKLGIVQCDLQPTGRYEQVRDFLRKWGVIGEDEEAEVFVDGVRYLISDIGLRMLRPRELFTANGFRKTYDIAPLYKGKPLTTTSQVKKCGNSVPPQLAAAVLSGNKDALEYQRTKYTALPLFKEA